jgi:hypothetical protein
MSSRAATAVILLVVFAILAVNVFAIIHDLYFYYSWLDVVMHLVGGFWIGFVSLAIIQWKLKRALPLKERMAYAFLLAFGVGVLWEMFELLSDTSFALEPYVYDAADTFSDLLNDLFGGVVAGLIGHIHQHQEETKSV